MNIVKSVCIFFLCGLFAISAASAAEDVDWEIAFEPVTESGPDTPVVGKRWSIGSRRSGITITFHLDAAKDMSQGNWHGRVQVPEKFYGKFYLVGPSGAKRYLKIEHARALGPDAAYGAWKEGPETVEMQSMSFDLTRDKVLAINGAKTLVFAVAPDEDPNDETDILFPLENFPAQLAKLDALIKSEGGKAFLLTEEQSNTTPMKELPLSLQDKWKSRLDEVSKELSVPLDHLQGLSINEIKALVEDRKKALKAEARAAKEAEHQAIYDQEPDWADLNVCPKPDVNFCRNVGKDGYEVDNMFGNEYDYGEIVGVVWRSEGSIIHVYGGSLDLDIDPEISRARKARYYYILKNDKGFLELRPADTIRLRN